MKTKLSQAMQYLSIYLFMIIPFIYFTSCSQKSTIETIYFDKSNIQKRALFSDLFEYVETISLETTDSNIIGKIDKISINNEMIYILDRTITKSLFIFSFTGDFINMISRTGNGPGEYSNIYDFVITDDGITLFSGYPNKLMFFSPTGEYLKEIKTFASGTRLGLLISGNFMIYTCGMPSNFNSNIIMDQVIEINKEGSYVESFLESITVNRGYSGCYSPEYFGFTANNDSIRLSFPFSDTIFTYQNGEMTPRFFIDFGKLRIPESFHFSSRQKVEDSGFAYGISRLLENNRFLFFTMKYRNSGAIVIFDKKTKSTKVVKSLFDDLYFVFPNIINF